MKNTTSTKEKITYLVLLIINTALSFALYRTLLFFAEKTNETLPSFVVLVFYSLLLLGFGLAYLIYNRFFYKKDITPEQLPNTMTYDEKLAWIEEGKTRIQKSKWMLLVIIPLLLTFMLDAVDLFIIDLFRR